MAREVNIYVFGKMGFHICVRVPCPPSGRVTERYALAKEFTSISPNPSGATYSYWVGLILYRRFIDKSNL